jgi:hypothetical protein
MCAEDFCLEVTATDGLARVFAAEGVADEFPGELLDEVIVRCDWGFIVIFRRVGLALSSQRSCVLFLFLFRAGLWLKYACQE